LTVAAVAVWGLFAGILPARAGSVPAGRPAANVEVKGPEKKDGFERETGATYSGPDEGIFSLKGQRPSDGTVSSSDDGCLWFQDVTSGSAKFHNLVGNVAEFVYSDKSAQKFSVIGGSALSPPDLWDGASKPFSTAYDYDQAGAKEFSDVGFRLAFTAPQKSIVESLREAIKAAKYIAPAA